MRESILTIPISEIFEPKCGCPICTMREMLEKRTIEYIMGAAMMEPDVRIETNRLGFCREHYNMMLKQKNRLSLALMLQTHLETINHEVFEKKGLFGSTSKKQKAIGEYDHSCFVCSKVDWGMERLMVTVFDMYENSEDFRKLFAEQPYICMRDCDLLIEKAQSEMNKKYQSAFISTCIDLAGKYCGELYDDVSHYCSMYDYRNSGPDADWGNSRDSIERAIKFLTGRDA
ncbi:MAG: DUF6062 family protein [Oscillospiraceae bacterium]|nr:DUF6062 family protein [Oscillospiraceae bacterium]